MSILSNEQLIFSKRRTIINNIDLLFKYGKDFNKEVDKRQLSLFGTEEISITKPMLEEYLVSDYELMDLFRKEIELTGMSLTHNPFKRFFLLEKTLCNTNVEKASKIEYNNSSLIFLAMLEKKVYATNKNGASYYRLSLERNGMSIPAYLSGIYFQKNNDIQENQIYIVKVIFKNGFYSVVKMQLADSINVSDYIKEVKIHIEDTEYNTVRLVRNYVFTKMKEKGSHSLRFHIGDQDYIYAWDIGFDFVNFSTLINMGCNITISKKI